LIGFFWGERRDLWEGTSEIPQTYPNHPILQSQQISGQEVQVVNFVARDKIQSAASPQRRLDRHIQNILPNDI